MSISKPLNGHVLYICYFGLREPLVQTQVLPYLRQVRDGGMTVSVLTFETDPRTSWTSKEIERERTMMQNEGIDWHFLTYHKTPTVPATLFDILNGAYFTWKFIRRRKPDIIHSRVHVPALMAAIAKRFTRLKSKLLFDIRGFFPEEYTDAGRWKEGGLLYRAVKRVEKWLLQESDGFVVLTEKAREIMFPESAGTGRDQLGRPVEVIPCCVDFERFRAKNLNFRKEFRDNHNIGDRVVITYVGSFGGWYLTKETVDFLESAKKVDDRLFVLILTQSAAEEIIEPLQSCGFSEKDYWIGRVSPEEIPEYLSVADIGLSFIKPCYSKQASSPTKNAEYLASGLPIIANSGVGDTALMTKADRVGFIIEDFSEQAYHESFVKILSLLANDHELADRSRNSALKRFDLEKVGGVRYKEIYRKLLNIP